MVLHKVIFLAACAVLSLQFVSFAECSSSSLEDSFSCDFKVKGRECIARVYLEKAFLDVYGGCFVKTFRGEVDVKSRSVTLHAGFDKDLLAELQRGGDLDVGGLSVWREEDTDFVALNCKDVPSDCDLRNAKPDVHHVDYSLYLQCTMILSIPLPTVSTAIVDGQFILTGAAKMLECQKEDDKISFFIHGVQPEDVGGVIGSVDMKAIKLFLRLRESKEEYYSQFSCDHYDYLSGRFYLKPQYPRVSMSTASSGMYFMMNVGTLPPNTSRSTRVNCDLALSNGRCQAVFEFGENHNFVVSHRDSSVHGFVDLDEQMIGVFSTPGPMSTDAILCNNYPDLWQKCVLEKTQYAKIEVQELTGAKGTTFNYKMDIGPLLSVVLASFGPTSNSVTPTTGRSRGSSRRSRHSRRHPKPRNGRGRKASHVSGRRKSSRGPRKSRRGGRKRRHTFGGFSSTGDFLAWKKPGAACSLLDVSDVCIVSYKISHNGEDLSIGATEIGGHVDVEKKRIQLFVKNAEGLHRFTCQNIDWREFDEKCDLKTGGLESRFPDDSADSDWIEIADRRKSRISTISCDLEQIDGVCETYLPHKYFEGSKETFKIVDVKRKYIQLVARKADGLHAYTCRDYEKFEDWCKLETWNEKECRTLPNIAKQKPFLCSIVSDGGVCTADFDFHTSLEMYQPSVEVFSNLRLIKFHAWSRGYARIELICKVPEDCDLQLEEPEVVQEELYETTVFSVTLGKWTVKKDATYGSAWKNGVEYCRKMIGF